MAYQTPITVDFETDPVQPRPDYPPKPVGVAIWWPGKRPRYLAWDHPCENNTTKRDAARELRAAWRSSRPLLFHHASFDLEVGEVHFDLPPTPVERTRCTMIEAFLYDPNEEEVGLKPLADKHLDMPPDEADELRDWIVANVPGAKRKKSEWGAHIAKAPGRLVGRYAVGDVVRTRKLGDFFWPVLVEDAMLGAYERELRMFPVLRKMERRGVPITVDRLRDDCALWARVLDDVDEWVRRRLGARRLDVDKRQELVDALDRKKLVDDWPMTAPSKTFPQGQRSTAWKLLEPVVKDRELVSTLFYRSRLANAVRNFATPWLEMADKSGGVIYTRWNQVRQLDESGKPRRIGTRTGRLSSTPNLQNMPKKPAEVVFTKKAWREADKRRRIEDRPKPILLPRACGSWPQIPNVRDYVIARIQGGGKLIGRDYSQQEPRILAHFAGGQLREQYLANPWLDLHEYAHGLILAATGEDYERVAVKRVGLGVIYSLGAEKLGIQIDLPTEDARELRQTYRNAIPAIDDVDRECKRRGRRDEPIRTWGGRVNYCEPPRVIKGELRTFEYKMLNTLIQGSAADNTKQAMVNYDSVAKDGYLLIQAHDELLGYVEDARAAHSEMKLLREAMEDVDFTVPMLTEGYWGDTWGSVVDYDKKGEEVWRGR